MSGTGWGEAQAAGVPSLSAPRAAKGKAKAERPAARRPASPILAGFAQQIRVVHALLLREMQTRFGRRPLGFGWLFLEPLLFAGAMALLREVAGFGATIPGVSIFVFALVSYLPFFAFRAIVARAPAMRGSLRLLFHTPIKLLDIVLARHLLEGAAVISVMTLLVLGVSTYGSGPPASIPILALGLAMLLLYSHGLGMLAGAAAARWSTAGKLIQPVLFLSLPLSGALMALHHLDPAIRSILLWNPQVHMHEMMREGFFGARLPGYYDVIYVGFCVAVVNLLGMAALRAVRPTLNLSV